MFAGVGSFRLCSHCRQFQIGFQITFLRLGTLLFARDQVDLCGICSIVIFCHHLWLPNEILISLLLEILITRSIEIIIMELSAMVNREKLLYLNWI